MVNFNTLLLAKAGKSSVGVLAKFQCTHWCVLTHKVYI